MSESAARAVRRSLGRGRCWLRLVSAISLLVLGFAAFFMGTLYYASVVDKRIARGMDKDAVDGLCWLGTQRVSSLAQTSLAATMELPAGYASIVIYRIGGFHPIEVVYSSDSKVMAVLPAYE
jgi:hypothetical protein